VALKWPEASSQTGDPDRGTADTGAAPIIGRDQAVWWIIATGAVLLAVIALEPPSCRQSAGRRTGRAKHVLNTTTFIIAEHLEGTLQSCRARSAERDRADAIVPG